MSTNGADSDALIKRKRELLKAQTTLVEEFNSLLTKTGEEDGAIETSRRHEKP